MENIIFKIQRLLALSKSSNENEAQNAMIMAQRLLILSNILFLNDDDKNIDLFECMQVRIRL